MRKSKIHMNQGKSRVMRSCPAVTAALFFIVMLTYGACSCAEDMSLSIAPSEISISAFYNGSSIKATGTVPAGADVIVRITGAGEEVHLKKKGKVGGLLWMNTGKITFKNIPAVFMIYTTPELAKTVNTINLGYLSVKEQVKMEPEEEAKEALFKEFAKLKEEEGVYVIDSESLQYKENTDGSRHFEINITVPPKMKPGQYSVEAYAVAGGNVTNKANTALIITMIGFPAWIAGLAFGHALLHGIMAVIVALVAGLAMGLLFRGGGGAH